MDALRHRPMLHQPRRLSLLPHRQGAAFKILLVQLEELSGLRGFHIAIFTDAQHMFMLHLQYVIYEADNGLLSIWESLLFGSLNKDIPSQSSAVCRPHSSTGISAARVLWASCRYHSAFAITGLKGCSWVCPKQRPVSKSRQGVDQYHSELLTLVRMASSER